MRTLQNPSQVLIYDYVSELPLTPEEIRVLYTLLDSKDIVETFNNIHIKFNIEELIELLNIYTEELNIFCPNVGIWSTKQYIDRNKNNPDENIPHDTVNTFFSYENYMKTMFLLKIVPIFTTVKTKNIIVHEAL